MGPRCFRAHFFDGTLDCQVAEESSADYRGSLGRYALFGEIAAGGMATVHLARLLGPVGFARTVAIKRLHPHLSKNPDFVGMFLEEARLAARVRHPNVVATLDVVAEDGELFLVMEYVPGESLSRLVRKSTEKGAKVPPHYAVAIISGALEGLHAAHEAKSEKGKPLGLVHRDVSPQNVHVGLDGVPRVLDFGIAKATNRVQETRTDQLKGKVAYMSSEQLAKGPIDRRADVYSASVVLWEALTGRRLFKADDLPSLVYAIVNQDIPPPSLFVPDLPPGLDAIVMKGLERKANERWSSAREMAAALERVLAPAPAREIGDWVNIVAGEALEWRQDLVHRIESETSRSMPPPLRLDSPSSPIEIASGVVPTEPSYDARAEAPTITNEDRESARPDERVLGTSTPPTVTPTAPEARISDRRARTGWVAVAMVGLLTAAAIVGGWRFRQVSSDSSAAAPPAAVPVPAPAASEDESAIVIGITREKKPRGGAAAHDDCDPPYIVDARGIRHTKAQCANKPK